MARQGNGRLKGTVALDTRRMAYNAQLQAHQLPVQQFLPRMGLRPFTGTINAKGVGTDFLSPHTHLQAKARIVSFGYGGFMRGKLKGGGYQKKRQKTPHHPKKKNPPKAGGKSYGPITP